MSWQQDLSGSFPAPSISNGILTSNAWRGIAYVVYWVFVATFCFLLSFWLETRWFLFLTFAKGEVAYPIWHSSTGISIWAFLPIVLLTGTIGLAACWFILFRGNDSISKLWLVRRWFNPKRHRRFGSRLRKKEHLRLFVYGLTPQIWFIGFFYLTQNKTKWGLMTILAGNATKLFVFAVAFHVAFLSKYALIIILAIAFVVFFPFRRVIEKILPNDKPPTP